MINLRYYQTEAADSAISALLDRKNPCVALPTGAGKTYTIGAMIKKLKIVGYDKFLILSHVKEILVQNKIGIERYLETGVCVYSAGLNQREIGSITVASIQSIYKKGEQFKDFQIIIIDEAHLINDSSESMYRTFFSKLNGHYKIGLTATPFRLGSGYIYGYDKIFDVLAYDCTSKEDFNKLIDKKYLCNLVTRGTVQKLSTENVRTTAGDFNEKDLARVNNVESVTSSCVNEIIRQGHDRKKWLVFAIDIDHAEHIAELLIRKGVPTALIHSKMDMDREIYIEKFRKGIYQCIVNVNILTTGFDVPDIDLIALMRPTKSPVLHVQTIGRGMRVAEGKANCLVMDFAGNVSRLGPINDIRVKAKGKTGIEGDAPVKECPDCLLLVHIKVKTCPECEYVFPIASQLKSMADIMSPIDRPINNMIWLEVDGVEYFQHQKHYGPKSIRVEYSAHGGTITEWIHLEHTGYAKFRADAIMSKAGHVVYNTVKDFLENKEKFRKPRKILIDISGRFPEVKERIY